MQFLVSGRGAGDELDGDGRKDVHKLRIEAASPLQEELQGFEDCMAGSHSDASVMALRRSTEDKATGPARRYTNDSAIRLH